MGRCKLRVVKIKVCSGGCGTGNTIVLRVIIKSLPGARFSVVFPQIPTYVKRQKHQQISQSTTNNRCIAIQLSISMESNMNSTILRQYISIKFSI